MTATTERSFAALDPQAVAELPWHPVEDWAGVEQKVLSTHHGVVIGMLRLQPGAQEADHCHTHSRHDAWVLAGEVQMGGRVLGAGSFVSVPQGVAHTLRDQGAGCLLLYVFSELT